MIHFTLFKYEKQQGTGIISALGREKWILLSRRDLRQEPVRVSLTYALIGEEGRKGARGKS